MCRKCPFPPLFPPFPLVGRRWGSPIFGSGFDGQGLSGSVFGEWLESVSPQGVSPAGELMGSSRER